MVTVSESICLFEASRDAIESMSKKIDNRIIVLLISQLIAAVTVLRSTVVFRLYSCVSGTGCSSLGLLRNRSI